MTRFRRTRRPWRPSVRTTHQLLTALRALYDRLRTPRPLDDLLQAILDTALQCIPGAQRGSLLTLADDKLRYRATVGYDLEQLRGVTFPAERVFEAFLPNGRSAQVYSYAEWDTTNLDPANVAILREHGGIALIRSSLVTSILVGGRPFGTLVLDNLHSHAPFPASARALAELFADHAGTLIEQAELLEQVRQANSQLQEAERLATLGRFIAGIAHEINNPLTAVLGYADFLALKDLDPEGQELLGQLRNGAERVRGIVRNLQLFARQQRTGAALVDVNQSIEQALTLKRSELKTAQIQVVARCAKNLPAIWGDGGGLSQILLQLIGNAQDALRDQPLPRQMTISSHLLSEVEPNRIQVRVIDNGPGISAALRNRIFEPFFSTKPSTAGAGLGLSISRKIAADHQGVLRLDAGADKTTFVLELPILPTPHHTPAPPPGERPPNEHMRLPTTALQGLLVLVVDDDPAVVALIRHALSGSNRISVAGNGQEALSLCAIEPFDLILCDLRMPVLSGPEFYERLRRRNPDLAASVIFISGDTTNPETRAFVETCGRPLLHKPFTSAELHAMMLSAMRGKAQ